MPEPERVYKVVLFGVTGCGKSSIINLLAEKPVANVSTGVEACTKRAQWYPISLGNQKFRLWDTMGFNQAEAKDTNPLSPYEQAHALLRNLHEGVDLILVCARKDGINVSLRSLYWLLHDFFFDGHARMGLVLTHFDASDGEEWWIRNRNSITQRCNIPSSLPHACITTIHTSSQPHLIHDRSKQVLQELLQSAITTPSPTPLRFDLSSDHELRATATQRLSSNCSLSNLDAMALVDKLRLPKRPFRAILFGETGAGKSSVINLIAGYAAAVVSHGIDSCTLESRSHRINTGLHQFLIWDTVGLNGTYIGRDTCAEAIENAARLVRELHEQGGVDLLIFCRKYGRLSPSELSSFTLFYEFLCEGQIPVAFIISHLENQDPMEKWWEQNGEGLTRACKLKTGAIAGHACVTSLDNSVDQRIKEKRSLSRQSILAMLEDSISYGGTFNKDEGTWVMSFLRRLILGLVRVGNTPKRERMNPKNLKERCGLNKDQAEELIKLLYASRE